MSTEGEFSIEGSTDEVASAGIGELVRRIDSQTPRFPKFLHKFLSIPLTVTNLNQHQLGPSAVGTVTDMLIDAGYKFELQYNTDGVAHFKIRLK